MVYHEIILLFSLLVSVHGIIYVSLSGNSTLPCGTQVNPCSNLYLAIRTANIGDTIAISPGVYTGPENSNIQLTSELHFISLNGSDNTVMDLTGSGFGFMTATANFSIDGITFRNSNQNAGVIKIRHSDTQITAANVSNCAFLNNTGINGGAIDFNTEGTLLVSNTVFSGNLGNANGGAIAIRQSGVANVTNCNFTHNHAAQGGAIYTVAILGLNNSYFAHNDGHTDGGGALSVQGGDSALEAFNTNFIDNEAVTGGVILMNGNADCSFYNCNFIDNYALSNGGVVYAEGYTALRIEKAELRDNEAGKFGGAVYLFGTSRAWIKDASFTENGALGVGGGAIAAGEESEVDIENVHFSNNTANYYGGAIFLQYSGILRLNRSSINYNIANNTDGHGGGIYCSNSKIFIYSTDFTGNYNPEDQDPNLYCAGIPIYTWCTIKGDGDWSSKCGEANYHYPGSSSGPLHGFPVLGIVGFVLGGVSIVFCILVVIGLIRIKRRNAQARKEEVLERVSKQFDGPTQPPKEDMELLADYDD